MIYTKIKFLGWIIKNYEMGAPGSPAPISLWSEYSSSNWFHSNATNSWHLFNTNCNTNNTNMDLIHFHSKNNIQMSFQKS